MIDGSHLPFEENIALTREVVEKAKPGGISVEGELGRLAGIEDNVSVSEQDAIFTDPGGAAFSVWKPGQSIGAEVCNEPNTYSWNELMTRDIDAALPFYSAVFGWTYDAMDMGPAGTYHVISGGESGGLGGLMAMPPGVPEQVPNHWGVYFAVTDADATIAAITAAGGQVVNGPMDIPGVGRTATVHDPQGGNFNVMQPAG